MKPLIILFSILLSGLGSCTEAQNTNAKPAIKNVNAERFREEMQKPDVIILDVRTQQEVSRGKIEGSVHIDWLDDAFGTEAGKLDKDKTILVYCASGGRSEEAGQWFIENGFTSVYNLSEGLAEWKAAGYPVLK